MDALAVEPARDAVVLHVVEDAAEVPEPHRRAVAVGDDQGAELRGVRAAGRSACTVSALFGPQSMPVGRLTLPAPMARRRPRRCRCRARASARGSSWTRTAYFCEPNDVHLRHAARPSRCAAPASFSAYSSSAESGSVVEVQARG